MPPISALGVGGTGNAKASVARGAFVPLQDAGFGVGLPFRLYGSSPVPAGKVERRAFGCGGSSITWAGAPVLGGFVHVEVGGTVAHPTLLGFGLTSRGSLICPGCRSVATSRSR